jgi:hypothetical protein
MEIQGPITFNLLPASAQAELVQYLAAGNTREDLAKLYLRAIVHEDMVRLIDELKGQNAQYVKEIGDSLWPNVANLEIKR